MCIFVLEIRGRGSGRGQPLYHSKELRWSCKKSRRQKNMFIFSVQTIIEALRITEFDFHILFTWLLLLPVHFGVSLLFLNPWVHLLWRKLVMSHGTRLIRFGWFCHNIWANNLRYCYLCSFCFFLPAFYLVSLNCSCRWSIPCILELNYISYR